MADPTGRDREVLSVLFEVTRRLNDGADLEAILGIIAGAAARLSGGESASVLLLDEGRERLLVRAHHGLTDAEIGRVAFRLGEGLAGWVAAEGRALRLDDAPADPRFKHIEGQARRIRSACCVPLTGRDGTIGVMTVTSSETAAFGDDDEAILAFLAASVVKDVENARLYRLAVTDPLTGVFNRQYLSERMPAEFERHRRYGDPLSIALVDADHFKRINDTKGHAVGDTVLKVLAQRCLEAVREVDAVVRYGGEEFLLVFPRTEREGGREVAERLLHRVRAAPVKTTAGEVPVTVSVGVAEVLFADSAPADLIARADAALYEAKSAGRDRVVVAT